MHIAYPLYFRKIYKCSLHISAKFIHFPIFVQFRFFGLIYVFSSPILAMKHLSIMLDTLFGENMSFTRAENELHLAWNVQNRFGFWGSTPDPAGGAYNAPSDP